MLPGGCCIVRLVVEVVDEARRDRRCVAECSPTARREMIARTSTQGQFFFKVSFIATAFCVRCPPSAKRTRWVALVHGDLRRWYNYERFLYKARTYGRDHRFVFVSRRCVSWHIFHVPVDFNSPQPTLYYIGTSLCISPACSCGRWFSLRA